MNQSELKKLMTDSGEGFLAHLEEIGREDAAGLKKAYKAYGDSWKSRGGVGAYMMACRKFDRMDNRLGSLKAGKWDIFLGIATDKRGEGLIDDVRDLRRYLTLIEAEMRARGFRATHRDNRKGVIRMTTQKKAAPKPAVKSKRIGKGKKTGNKPC